MHCTLLAYFPPLYMAPTATYLEERSHRLISRPNLNLEEGRLLAVASILGALCARLVGVVPLARTAKDVLALLALKFAARIDWLGDGVLEGTGAALEAVADAGVGGDGQDVCAVGADWRGITLVGVAASERRGSLQSNMLATGAFQRV